MEMMIELPVPGDGNNPAAVAATLTAVAVEKDSKVSLQTVRWALDNLLVNNHTMVLIHVRGKPAALTQHAFSIVEATPEAIREQLEAERLQLFQPYRGLTARKGIKLKEVILDDTDVTKAIVDYIATNLVHNVVVGSSPRNALAKKFKSRDISSEITKTAPEFCTVYVVSKGKVVTVRSAKCPPPANTSPPGPAPTAAAAGATPNHILAADEPARNSFKWGQWRGNIAPPPLPDRKSLDKSSLLPDRKSFERSFERSPDRTAVAGRAARSPLHPALQENLDFAAPPLHAAKTAPPHLALQESFDYGSRPWRPAAGSQDFSVVQEFRHHSTEFSGSSPEFLTPANHSPGSSSPSLGSQTDMEAEMKRLRLELKQTMDMYSTACKEAITAKQRAKQLQELNMEEARRFEEARHAEEAALALAAMEKAKCRAAMEAAHASQRIAEIEAQKRQQAELKARRETEEKKKALDALAHSEARYRKYSIEEVEMATEQFSDSLKIGEGGYGPVYKACLDHTPVAIKVLRPDAAHGMRQFQQEVEVLSCIRHPNMVLLLGACPEYGCLVYEYMDNGSLEDRIFQRGNTPPMPWSVRFKIAAEIATGLLFLHQAKPEPIVHRDLKPGNILLDHNYVSKIADVGLARLVPASVASNVTMYRMTSAAGTFCYIDPEYQQTGMLGIKSDVYSLGILLLQLITARPPMGLSHQVERSISTGTFHKILDPAVSDWPVEEALGFAKLALKCSEMRRRDRPDLGTVVLPELNRLRNLGHAHEAALRD